MKEPYLSTMGSRKRRNKRTKGEVTHDDVGATYEKLNIDAMHLIIKNLDKQAKWEVELGSDIKIMKQMSRITAMKVPCLKRAASKYHEEHS